MRKQMVLFTVFLACVFMITMVFVNPSVYASIDASRAQVWGYEASGAGFSGQDAYLTTPNPNLGTGTWTAGPSGVSNKTDTFMESGPTKACDLDCELHPYGAWHNKLGNWGENVDQSLVLLAGYEYEYYVVNGIDGKPNKWRAYFCTFVTCYTMVTGNLRTNQLPYISSGGESSPSNVHWGSITTRYNTYKDGGNGNWYSWCYQYIQNNVNGTLSACNSSNHSWTASY